MENLVVIREAEKSDHPFIFELSPYLAEPAQLDWHSDEVIHNMHYDYISEMLEETPKPNITFIAEINNISLGFIHVRTHEDGVSGETCGTIPLLAVSPKSQGLGLGKLLIEHAEKWAKNLGCRLLHLEVFSNNKKAYNKHFKRNKNSWLGFASLHIITNNFCPLKWALCVS